MSADEAFDMLDVDAAPGVYDMPLATYLADPIPGGSLSHSGAKRLLTATPAHFLYESEHGRPDTKAFDLGHAAHSLVLGTGPELVVVPDEICAKDGGWSTRDAKAFALDVRERGGVPLHPTELAAVQAMADALRDHPTAAKLLDPDRGAAEQSIFWVDHEFDVWRRARLDLLPHQREGRMIVVDYKTTVDASPESFSTSMARYGYNMQAPWYCDGVTALGLAADAVLLFVAQEKTPPYLVNVIEPVSNAVRIGRERNRKALAIYKQCTESGEWPGYGTGINLLDVPFWAERQHEMDMLK